MPSLDTSNSATAWDDNFSNDSSLDRSLWKVEWGNSNNFTFANGALTLSSTAADKWSNTGFMQSDFGSTSGEGYGVYSVTASLDAGQGTGACINLWPANNQWPGAEIDLLETNASRTAGYATVHWAGSNDSNASSSHDFSLNLTQKNVFSIDWEKGSLTYYINGQEIFQTTSHVPLDAADGGVNESLGAEVTNAQSGAISSQVDLNLYNMSYTPSNGSAAASAATTPTAASAASAATIPATAASTVASTTPVFITASHTTSTLTSGETLSDSGSANTLVFPAAGGVTLNSNVLGNSDSFDLRSVMAQTNWNGQSSSLDQYLTSTTANGGKDLQVLLHPTGGSASSLLATVTSAGQNPTALATFEQHALLK